MSSDAVDTDLAAESARYFESLKDPRALLDRWEAERRDPPLRFRLLTGWIVVWLGLFALSLFPVLPWLVAVNVLGERPSVSFETGVPFVVAWVCLTALTFVAAKVAADYQLSNSPVDRKAPVSFSGRQLAYIHVASARRGLEQYFVTRVPAQLELAISELRSAFRGATTIQRSGEEVVLTRPTRRSATKREYMHTVYTSTSRSLPRSSWALIEWELRTVGGILTRNTWIGVDSSDTDRLSAIAGVAPAVMSHTRAGEDLDSVLRVLRELELFLFATLSENPMRRNEGNSQALDDAARTHADALAVETRALGVLEPPLDPRPGRARRAVAIRAIRGASRFLPVRFVSWLAVLLVVLTGFMLVVGGWLHLSAEATVTIVVPTSVLGAASLAVLTKPLGGGGES